MIPYKQYISVITSSKRCSLCMRSQRYFISWCQRTVCASLDGDERQQLQGLSTHWQRCKLPQNDIKHGITLQNDAKCVQTSHNNTKRLKKGGTKHHRTSSKGFTKTPVHDAASQHVKSMKTKDGRNASSAANVSFSLDFGNLYDNLATFFFFFEKVLGDKSRHISGILSFLLFSIECAMCDFVTCEGDFVFVNLQR